jgi:DNA-binding response OmpR family regulator
VKDRYVILIVGRNRTNLELLDQFLGKEGYDTLPAANLEELDPLLADERTGFDLALVDLSGFDKRIWQRCETLRGFGIPFLILSPRQSSSIHRESVSSGARGFMVKPLVIRELLEVVRGLLEEEH